MSDNVKAKSNKGNNKNFFKILGFVIIVILVLVSIYLNYFTKNYLYNGKIAECFYSRNRSI